MAPWADLEPTCDGGGVDTDHKSDDMPGIPTRGRMPVQSTHFCWKEFRTRCQDMLRTVKSDEIAVQDMQDKGLAPDKDRKIRHHFVRRILVSCTTCGRSIGLGRSGTCGRFGALRMRVRCRVNKRRLGRFRVSSRVSPHFIGSNPNYQRAHIK